MRTLYFVILHQLLWVAGCHELSNYLRTLVLVENYNCTQEYISPALDILSTSSLIGCARKCSSHTDCRRLMFNTDTNDCVFYESGENCFVTEESYTTVCFRQNCLCNAVNCTRCPIGYYGDICQNIIEDCNDGAKRDVIPSKKLLSYIRPSPSGPVLEVQCDARYAGATLIQTRHMHCQHVDFNRTWQDYVEGFGQSHGNYWLGLDNVYNILQNFHHFRLTVNGASGDPRSPVVAMYDAFNLTTELQNYQLSIDTPTFKSNYPSYDSLTVSGYSINGRPFSTYDRDHTSHNCPGRFGGGWWYLDDPVCSLANLNGRLSGGISSDKCHWSDLGNMMDQFYTMSLKLKRQPV